MSASVKSIREQNFAALESVRDLARQVAEASSQAAETTRDAVRTTIETASRTLQSSAEQVAHSLGLSGEHAGEVTRQSTQNVEAITECGAILMRGFQEISREWLSLAQHNLQRNLEGFQALASCRTVQDAVATQTKLVRDNIQQIVDDGRHIAETSAKVANEAAQTLTGSDSTNQPRRTRAA